MRLRSNIAFEAAPSSILGPICAFFDHCPALLDRQQLVDKLYPIAVTDHVVRP
jgi:hypothetical protein